MASPVNIRASSPIPFPALVVGGMPVTVTKKNGIWTLGFDIVDLTQRVPVASDLPVEFLIVYDSIIKTFFKVALNVLGVGGALLQRSVTASPIVVAANDQRINFNINAAAACTLPASATRNGIPLTFKDCGGHATAHPLVFSTTGGETMDGIASGGVSIATNYQEMTFTPYNDGVNTGWALS